MMTLMVLLPGPDWAYLIAAGTTERAILPSLAGILVGYLAVVAAVAVGVGAAVAALPWVLVVLTLSAAAYLTYLGVQVLRKPPVVAVAADAGGHGASVRFWMRLAQGAGVSGLNPKGLLVLVVLLPQFTDASGAWPMPVQLAVLGLIFVASCALVYSLVGLGARTVLRVRPSAMRIVSRVSGAAMIVLAGALVIEQVSHLATT
ncbi:LysE family translocator [Agromyces intestinalis]|uniref:LysE family translocator n=2 Tax=Agromyces intestinalis TaxID=2592652 RepID=A0A5C1YJ92_9MICO|nr:LysE family translocator [Agromyces intestinalis]